MVVRITFNAICSSDPDAAAGKSSEAARWRFSAWRTITGRKAFLRAVSVRDAGGGPERLVVFAVTRGAADPGQLKPELDARLKRELNPLFRIHDLVVVDRLPYTASNKLLRRELRRGYPTVDAAGNGDSERNGR